MATIHNPSAFNLWCEPADQEIAAGDTVQASDEVAARVSRCVFVVKGVAEVEEASEPAEEAPSSKPVRRTVKKGASEVEVTEAPAREQR